MFSRSYPTDLLINCHVKYIMLNETDTGWLVPEKVRIEIMKMASYIYQTVNATLTDNKLLHPNLVQFKFCLNVP